MSRKTERQTVGMRSFRAMVRRAIDHHGEEFVTSWTFNKVDSRQKAMFVMAEANQRGWSADAKEIIAERAAKYSD